MLDDNDIHALDTINIDIAKLAFLETEKRFTDQVETRASIERKSTLLFGVFVTIALTLFGVGGRAWVEADALLAWPFFASGLLYVVGAGCFIYAVRGMEYGNLGSEANDWLVAGRLDGNEAELGRCYAYHARFNQKKIDASFHSNAEKIRAMHWGMWSGLIGVVALFLLLLIAAPLAY